MHYCVLSGDIDWRVCKPALLCMRVASLDNNLTPNLYTSIWGHNKALECWSQSCWPAPSYVVLAAHNRSAIMCLSSDVCLVSTNIPHGDHSSTKPRPIQWYERSWDCQTVMIKLNHNCRWWLRIELSWLHAIIYILRTVFQSLCVEMYPVICCLRRLVVGWVTRIL